MLAHPMWSPLMMSFSDQRISKVRLHMHVKYRAFAHLSMVNGKKEEENSCLSAQANVRNACRCSQAREWGHPNACVASICCE